MLGLRPFPTLGAEVEPVEAFFLKDRNPKGKSLGSQNSKKRLVTLVLFEKTTLLTCLKNVCGGKNEERGKDAWTSMVGAADYLPDRHFQGVEWILEGKV